MGDPGQRPHRSRRQQLRLRRPDRGQGARQEGAGARAPRSRPTQGEGPAPDPAASGRPRERPRPASAGGATRCHRAPAVHGQRHRTRGHREDAPGRGVPRLAAEPGAQCDRGDRAVPPVRPAADLLADAPGDLHAYWHQRRHVAQRGARRDRKVAARRRRRQCRRRRAPARRDHRRGRHRRRRQGPAVRGLAVCARGARAPRPTNAIADLARHLLETDQPELIKLVSERSEGNPFYASELVRSYLEHGSLDKLPDTVQATVLARLDLLPTEERRLLQLGSVFGRTFRAAGVVALGLADAVRVEQLCEDLIDRDLIRSTEGDRYTFRHILIQEVAYGTLPRAERARLHAEAARWGESIAGEREVALAEILAFHYREAALLYTALERNSETALHTREQAARWLLLAADVAVAAGATPEAVRHIRAAFEFLPADRLPRLHERIGDLTAGDAGLEEYRLALELYENQQAPVDDQLRALAGLLMVATRWAGSVGDRPSEDWLNDLRAKGRGLLARASNPHAIGRFLAADAFYPFWIQGVRDPTPDELAEAESNANRAIAIARVGNQADLESIALDALAGTAQAVGDWERARETANERIKFEDKLGLYERLDAHSMIAWM